MASNARAKRWKAPEGSFLRNYMDMMEEQETAQAYDFWTGMWLLSVAVGRRAFVARPAAPVYLNLYCVLLAESGITRKSSAIKQAADLAIALGGEIVTSRVSSEALLEKMDAITTDTGSAEVGIAISELVTFLGKSSVASGMAGLLTDLYDSPSRRRSAGTLSRGQIDIKNVFVSFLAASTPSWLRSVSGAVVEGGFTSRVIFVNGKQRKKKIAWPEKRQDTEKLVAQLQALRDEAAAWPEIGMTKAAMALFSRWYERRVEPTDPYRQSFFSREDAHVLRLAGLLCINRRAFEIDITDIQQSLRMVQSLRDETAKIFESNPMLDRTNQALAIIFRRLLAVGKTGMPLAVLVRATRNIVTVDVANSLIDVMHELELLQLHERLDAKTGKFVRWANATKLMKNRTAMNEVLRLLR